MRLFFRFAAAALMCSTCAAAQADARVIVKLRDQAVGLRQAQAVERTRSLAQRLGIALAHRSQPAPGMLALQASDISIDDLLARLADDPAVEFAVEDRLRTARARPNDTLYDSQWYLQSSEVSAIAADQAWDIVTGDGSVVVAVLDTGIRPEHPDLAPRLVPGYDFITDPALSGDGDGRDAVAVTCSEEILDTVCDATEVVVIDEGHFYDDGLPDVCKTLASRGKRVIIAALDLDMWGLQFPVIERIKEAAGVVRVQQSICAACGKPATHTHRKTPIVGTHIVGGAADFEPRCKDCWSPPKEAHIDSSEMA